MTGQDDHDQDEAVYRDDGDRFHLRDHVIPEWFRELRDDQPPYKLGRRTAEDEWR